MDQSPSPSQIGHTQFKQARLEDTAKIDIAAGFNFNLKDLYQ